MYSNIENFGGKMLERVKAGFRDSDRVTIASGYVSGDIIAQFEPEFCRIAENGGCVRLMVGMAFYEGLAGKNLRELRRIQEKLNALNPKCGIFVCYTGRVHAKIYNFEKETRSTIFIGSSNFSRSGLSENFECTSEIIDQVNAQKVRDYLDFLFSPENAVTITKADVTTLGSKQYLERISLETLSDLETYEPATIDKSKLSSFNYPLSRTITSEKSSLNVYFGKGRLSRLTGKVKPRDWYEVELIANQEINQNPLYPKGDFTAYTDDGYIMKMRTSGDYNKNIRSKGNLRILGQWIKGKLQKAGALIPLTPVTADTLDKYGNDSIRFYKIRDGEYYMEF